jgi:hypothetical protein
LHIELAERGGLVEPPRELDPKPLWGEVGIHGVARARQWDAIAAADAPGLHGDDVTFVVLPDGTLLGDEAQAPLADALDLDPPYRAEAVRREGELWAVAARRIAVVRLAQDIPGDVVELTVVDGDRSVAVDGVRTFGSIPELERPGRSYAVRAERLVDDLWEVRGSEL